MRFHVGFSFRLKYLKKFLFPILIGILAYFGFSGLFGCLQVHALQNMDTSFNLSYNSFYESENNYHGNDSLTYILYNMIDYYRNNIDNTQFELFINQCNNNYMCIYLIKKTNLIKNVNIYGNNYDSSNNLYTDISSKILLSSYTNGGFVFSLPISSNNNVLFSQWYNLYKSCVVTPDILYSNAYLTDCLNDYHTIYPSGFYSSIISSSSNTDLFRVNTHSLPLITNDSSYFFINANQFYYSSFDIYFRTNQNIVDSTNYFVKKINILNNSYGISNRVFSYFDIINGYGNTNDNNNFDVYNQLNKIYVGSISKSDINNFNLDLSYNYNSYDYSHSLSYNVLYFGRKNNSTYYSYTPLNCSATTSLYGSVFDTTNKKITTTIFPYGFSCSSDLTDYDNIYLYIEIIPSGSYDNTIYNLDLYVNYGNVIMQNGALSNFNGTYIYEKYTNLNPNFSILLSTNESSNNAYYRSNNNYIVSGSVNRGNNYIGGVSLNPFSFGTQYNSNGMIYNLPSYYSGVSSLDLFIHYNTIVSFSDNDVYTYYDSSNQLTTDTIINNRIVNVDNNDYNMSYYFSVVNGYINDLSLSIISFSQLTQSFYNSLPVFFQTFIFVIFILTCMYFTYLLIRK